MKPRERERERKKRLCFGGSARNETTQFWIYFEVYEKRTIQGEFVKLKLVYKSRRICDA